MQKKYSRTTRAVLLALLGVFVTTSVTFADVIWRRNGRKLEGTIIKEEAKRVLIRVRVGTIEAEQWIARSEIEMIERGDLPGAEFDGRLAKLQPHDLEGYKKLLAWAQSKRLTKEWARLEKMLPEVERLRRIHDFPRTWCRACMSVGKQVCAECEGTGKITTKCLRCSGTGWIKCRTCGHLKEGLLRCKKCVGKGVVETFDPAKGKKVKERCKACKGTGTQKCPTCGGKRKIKCPTCKGTGGSSSPCPRCDGNPLQVCATCGGSGIQKTALTTEEFAAETAARKKRQAEEARKAAEESKKPAGKTSIPGGKTREPSDQGSRSLHLHKPHGTLGADRVSSV